MKRIGVGENFPFVPPDLMSETYSNSQRFNFADWLTHEINVDAAYQIKQHLESTATAAV